MDQRTRRHCRRLAHAFHTGRVQDAFERAKLEPMSLRLVEARLLGAGREGKPLLGPAEGPGTVAVFDRVLDAAASVYPREAARTQQQLRRETEDRRR